MQLKSTRDATIGKVRYFALGRIGLIIVIALLAIGCPSNPGTGTVAKELKPFAGVKLKLTGSDPAIVKAFTSRAQGWASRTGATIEEAVGNAGTDIQILSPHEIGSLAEQGELLSIPVELKSLEHPCQWRAILDSYRTRLAGWAGEPRAIPLAGEGYVLVINSDRMADEALRAKYSAKFGRGLPMVPSTWEDVAEIAEAIRDLGATAWPARSDDEKRTLCDYFRVAACYDRPSLAASDLDRKAQSSMSLLSFTHVADTGVPRLNTPGFAAAAKWMERMEPCRSKDGGVTALTGGQASMGVLSLMELGRLKEANGTVPGRFAIAPLPGTRFAYDANGQSVDFATRAGGNYVPYFNGGWFGGVRKHCENPAAAFDLLADLSSPSRSHELLSDPELGCGPFRAEHLQQSREAIWQRYGFDAARQRLLAEALRRNIGEAITNPAFGLRGPDATALSAELANALNTGQPLGNIWRGELKLPIRRHAAGLP